MKRDINISQATAGIPRGALNAAGFIGCSNVATIMGVMPTSYDTPTQLQHRILNRIPDEGCDMVLRFGQHVEAFAAAEYTARTGLGLRRFTATLSHPEIAFLVGHPDRLVVPQGAKVAAHRGEIRTDTGWEGKHHSHLSAAAKLYGDEWSDQVPEWELVQCAGYMALTGCNEWHLGVILGGTDYRIFRVTRDLELEQMIEARVREWWQRHIINGVLCDPVTDDDLRTLYPSDNGKTVEADADAAAAVQALRSARAEADTLAQRIAALESAVKLALGPAATLTLDGKPLATWKRAKDSARFDLETYLASLNPGALPAEITRLAEDIERTYTITKPGSRRFLLKG